MSGSDFVDSLRISVVIALETLAGGLLWLALRRHSASTWPEVLGMGFALGSFLALLSSQMLRPTALSEVAWAVPAVVVMLVLLVARLRGHWWLGQVDRTDRGTVLLFLIGAAGLFLVLLPWFLTNLLDQPGWHTMFIDVPYFESMSNSLHVFGPADSTMAAGQP
ncbi:MAG: hypothetical protein WCI74_03780, partial [Actinomycetes bacterium]